MAYASLTDLTRLASTGRLIELTDRDDQGQIDTVVVDQALDDATQLIDSYLAARYTLPLATVPEVLRQVCARIAYRALHIEQVPEKVAHDHAADRKWLEAVAAGTVVLAGSSGTPPATAADVRVRTGTRRFGDLSGY